MPKAKKNFNQPRYSGSIKKLLDDQFPNWIEHFQRTPAKVTNFVKRNHANLRGFKKNDVFEIHTIISYLADIEQPGE